MTVPESLKHGSPAAAAAAAVSPVSAGGFAEAAGGFLAGFCGCVGWAGSCAGSCAGAWAGSCAGALAASSCCFFSWAAFGFPLAFFTLPLPLRPLVTVFTFAFGFFWPLAFFALPPRPLVLDLVAGISCCSSDDDS